MSNSNLKSLFSILFPSSPRDFPFRRLFRNILRMLHIFTTGVLIGGYIFMQPVAVLEVWLWWAVLSGLLLLITDLHASFAVLCEIRGLAVLAKIFLLLLVPFFPQASIPLLILVLFIGAIISHMSKHYRHKVIFFRARITPDDRSG